MTGLRGLHEALHLFSPVGEVALHAALGAAALAVLGLVAYGLLHRSGPALRHTLLSAVLAAALLVPAVRLVIVPHKPDFSALTEAPSWSPSPAAASASGLEWTAGPRVPAAFRPPIVAYVGFLLTLWGLGALLLGARLALGWTRTRRIVRAAHSVPDGPWRAEVERAAALVSMSPPRLGHSRHVASPFAFGILRPVVVLPSALLGASPSDRRAVVLHEMAHVRRRDPLWILVAGVARALYWPLPVIWWAAARLRLEGERAADAAVLGGGVPRAAYISQLLAMGDALRAGPLPPWATSTLGPPELYRRLRSLASGRRVASASRAVRALVWTIAALGTLGIAWAEFPSSPMSFISESGEFVSLQPQSADVPEALGK